MLWNVQLKNVNNCSDVQIKNNFLTPCLSTSAKSTPESSPVKIWSEKPLLTEKSLNFLPPQCILYNLVHLGGNTEWLIFLGELHPVEFWYYLALSVGQSLVSTRVSTGSQQSMMTFFPKYRELVKILGYDRLDLICFYQLFMVSWESFLKPFDECFFVW